MNANERVAQGQSASNDSAATDLPALDARIPAWFKRIGELVGMILLLLDSLLMVVCAIF